MSATYSYYLVSVPDYELNSLREKANDLETAHKRIKELEADLARLRSDNHQLTKLVADLTDELGRRKGEEGELGY